MEKERVNFEDKTWEGEFRCFKRGKFTNLLGT